MCYTYSQNKWTKECWNFFKVKWSITHTHYIYIYFKHFYLLKIIGAGRSFSKDSKLKNYVRKSNYFITFPIINSVGK